MATPLLRPGECELATYRANRTEDHRGAVGGELLLTNRRLVFSPHQVGRATWGQSWECELSSIRAVDVAERGRNPFNGSFRRRLRIEHDDSVDHFVVNRVEKVASEILLATLR